MFSCRPYWGGGGGGGCYLKMELLHGAVCSEGQCCDRSWGAGDLKAELLHGTAFIVQEWCESRGGRPGLSVLTSLLVSVDIKNY